MLDKTEHHNGFKYNPAVWCNTVYAEKPPFNGHLDNTIFIYYSDLSAIQMLSTF